MLCCQVLSVFACRPAILRAFALMQPKVQAIKKTGPEIRPCFFDRH